MRARVAHDQEEDQKREDKTGKGFWEAFKELPWGDTAAQWVAALAAAIGAAISYMAVLLVRDTLSLNRQSTNAAIAAVAVAERTLEQIKISNERQLRAYISVVKIDRSRRQEGDPWMIQLGIKNTGQTPAYNLKFWSSYKIIDSADEKTLILGEPKFSPTESDIGPDQGETIVNEMNDLTGDVWEEFKSFKKVIYYWGRVEFSDAFGGPRRWITFRYRHHGGYLRDFHQAIGGNNTSESANR